LNQKTKARKSYRTLLAKVSGVNKSDLFVVTMLLHDIPCLLLNIYIFCSIKLAGWTDEGWMAVEAVQNVLLRGVGWGNCDEKIIQATFIPKNTHITGKENRKGLRMIYLENSGSKNQQNSCST